MTALTPDQVAAKWSQRLTAAIPDIVAGVNAVTVSPGQQAAAAADTWASNVQNAKSKFARNVAKVDLNTWKTVTAAKDQARIADGATQGQPKMANAMAKLLPYINQQVNSLPARGNLEANIARSAAFIRGMSKFPGV